MPFLMLMPHEKGTLRAYVPSSAKAGKRMLRGLVGSDRAGCADFGGTTVSLGKTMVPVVLELPSAQPGAWTEIPVAANAGLVAFSTPRIE